MAGVGNLKNIYGSGRSVMTPSQTYSSQALGIGGVVVTPVNINSGVTLLSLSGRWSLNFASLNMAATTGTITLAVTVDGVIILNTVITALATQLPVFGLWNSATSIITQSSPIICDSSITIFASRTTADLTGLTYNAVSIV